MMSILKGLWVRLRALLFRERVEEELDDEIRFHLDMATEQLMRRSLSPDEARRRALLEFGGVERFKEKTRDARSLPLMEDLTRNLRVGLRRMASHPVHTLAIVGTLALGIGANTAIFSVVDKVLLRPSPFPEPDRLVMVWETDRASGTMHEPASWPDVVDFRERSRTLSALGSMRGVAATVTEGETPERVTGLMVTPGLMEVLGVEPLAGRVFADNEGSLVAPYTILLGEAYWRARFGADPDIVGRTIALSRGPATIVGVLPAEADLGVRQVHARADYAGDFEGGSVAVWLAMQPTAEAYPRQTHPFLTLGRLALGSDLETAQQELAAIAAELEASYPENDARGVNLEAYADVVFGPVRSALMVLLGAVAMVLLVACANVANLLLADTSARMREVAVRQAFGASHGLIRRQFLVESLLLTALGTAAGVALAYGGLGFLVAFAPADLPRLASVELDLRVLAFTTGLGGAVALLFGLLPFIQIRGSNLQEFLKVQGGPRGTAGRAVRRYRSGLVVAEIALAVTLVVGAGILVRSFWELQSVDLGFSTAGIVKAEYALPTSRYPEDSEINDFHRRYLERVRQIPGVEAATLAIQHPLDPGFTNSFVIPGREAESRDFPEIRTRFISPGYLDVVRVPLLEGRTIEEGDARGEPYVGVINQTAASQFFGEAGAVGRDIRFWGLSWRVVGVMGDERFRGPDQANEPAIYVPMAQIPWNQATLLLRSDREVAALAAEARRALQELDPALMLFGAEPLTAIAEESVSRPRFTATLLGVFAGVAILLAMIGVYGVLSYAVAQRGPEVGIRLALGASRGDVFREVVGEGLRVTVVGAALGAAAALATSRLLQGLVFGVSATDATTYVVVIGLVMSTAVLASLFPALRASRTDPVALLKAE